MPSYISSNANRLYVAVEGNYGQVPGITAGNRIPAVKFAARQQSAVRERRDKTGSRTFPGVPAGTRRTTSFALRTYMTNWSQTGQPSYGPLFEAALGGSPQSFGGGTIAMGSTVSQIKFANPHGLTVGQAVVRSGEMRFVDAILDSTTVHVNSPLSTMPIVGSAVSPTVTYRLLTELGSASVFDYWTPNSAVQRIVNGAAVNRLKIAVNGDYHGFEFSGPAQDVIDNSSFVAGLGDLTNFPAEPELGSFDHSIVPGHLGQAWIGTGPDRFYTLTDASVVIDNDLDLRAFEFGSALARCVVPGRRSVSLDFEVYEQDDAQTKALYQAARTQSPVSVMMQLGQANGQLCGMYMKSLVPEVPEFDDTDRRLKWHFQESRAQGTTDDEIVVSFG
ncbi:MAG: hypothetical protein ACKV22_14750 [Bryobacteraceae bacterium]